MARIRTIKPDFFTSEDVVGLSPVARLLYIATWLEADREGRMAWRPGTLKLRYLPGDSCSIDTLAAELIKAGLIVLYDADGQRLAYIPTFTKHQVINNRETVSELPAPPDAPLTRAPRVTEACTTRDDATGTPLVGKEGKGREGKEHASTTRAGDAPAPSVSGKVNKPKTSVPLDTLMAAGFDQQGAADFIAHKERNKAPLTDRAWADHCREAAQAGWTPLQAAEKVMAKGWKGFEAKYVANERPQRLASNGSLASRDVFDGVR